MGISESSIEISKWQTELLRKSVDFELEASDRNKILLDAYSSVEINKPPILQSTFAFILYGTFFLWCGIIGTYLDFDWLQMGYLGLTVVYVIYHYYIERKRWKHAISRALAINEIRPKLCLVCGYDLRGTVSAECPECGEKLAICDIESIDQS